MANLADQGKLKFLNNGVVDIVPDEKEQSVLQQSRKKEQNENVNIVNIEGKNLLNDFNEDDEFALEW